MSNNSVNPTDPGALIRAFCDSWSRANVDEMMSFFAEDAVYHNIPLAPTEGREAIRSFFQMFLTTATGFDFTIVNQAVSGNFVMNERIDTMTIGDKIVSLPVAGAFEVVDGQITAWRDYFDMAQFKGATA